MVTGDPQRLTQLARTVGQVIGAAAPGTHHVTTGHGHTASQQDGVGNALLSNDDIHAPMDPIRAVHIQCAGAIEHGTVSRRTPPEGVAGRVVESCVCLDLGDGHLGAALRLVGADPVPEQTACRLQHRSLKKR